MLRPKRHEVQVAFGALLLEPQGHQRERPRRYHDWQRLSCWKDQPIEVILPIKAVFMASATLERLVTHFDRREQRTLPPIVHRDIQAEKTALRARIVSALEILENARILEQRDSSGRTLVDSLITVAEGEFWEPFTLEPGRTRIFSELVLNLAEPKRINQGLKGTCAAACLESHLAERQPAEYARLIAGLVTREGLVTLKSGLPLACDEDVLAAGVLERGRNPVSRIFQAACMEFAYPNMNYDNVLDGLFDGDENVGTGLEMNAFQRLVEAVTGESWKTISTAHTRLTGMLSRFGMDTHDVVDIKRDGLSIIDQSTRQDEPVFVTLELPIVPNPRLNIWGSGTPAAPCAPNPRLNAVHADNVFPNEPSVMHNMPHKVRALQVDWSNRRVHYDDPMDPERRWFDGAEVTIHDPFGHCSMSIDDFLRLMTELTYRPALFKRANEDQQAPAQPRTE
jgi:hypothetical protein